MRREHLAVLSAVITAACVIPYLLDVRRGTTRPQRTSWFVFATLAAVAAVSQAAGEGGAGMWLAAGSAVGFSAVFVASIRNGIGGSAPVDRITLVIAAAGTAAWLLFDQPMLAVLGVIVAELGAVALTVAKAHRDPGSETLATWAADCLAGAVAVAATTDLSVAELAYPIHHTVANGLVAATIVTARRRREARAA